MATTASQSMHKADVSAGKSFDPSERLVFADFKGMLWPAVYYKTFAEFTEKVSGEVSRNLDLPAKNKICLDLMNEQLEGKKTGVVARFLGRPLSDYQKIEDESYRQFHGYLSQMFTHTVNKPEAFGRNQKDLFLDFHRGLDEAMSIMSSNVQSDSKPIQTQGSWVGRAEEAWDQRNPQLQHQRPHVPPPHSPHTNNSVAAVSLAEESYTSVVTGTPHTSATATSSPPQQEEESPQVLSPPPLEDSLSPVRNCQEWNEVWTKLAFSGWACVAEGGVETYLSPPPHSREYSEVEVKVYAQTRYGWTGGPRVTRNSARNTSDQQDRKEISYGMIWKLHLAPNGWTMKKGQLKIGDGWYYVKPGKSVEKGIQGQDYFISKDDVLEYCHRHQDYPESSSSEGEGSSPEQTIRNARQGDSEDDDESTQVPADSDTEGPSSLKDFQTPKSQDASPQEEGANADKGVPPSAGTIQTPVNQKTRPQDPGMPRLDSVNTSSSAESSVDEETRYHWAYLWPKLKSLGWGYKTAKSNLGSWEYFPPAQLRLDEGGDSKEWKEGVDYFKTPEDVIKYCRRKDGHDVSDPMDEVSSQERPRGRPRRAVTSVKDALSKGAGKKKDESNKKRSSEGVSKECAKSQGKKLTESSITSKTTKKKKSHLTSEKGKKKRQLQDAKGLKKTNAGRKATKKQRRMPAKEISVEYEGEDNPAPWARNIFPDQLHRLVVGAGANYRGCNYYLSHEDGKSSALMFSSANQVIQHCGTFGGLEVERLSSESDRIDMQRLLDYANVPLPRSAWPKIRSISIESTKSFLGVLGYVECSDGTWKVPDGMSQVLFKDTFPSLPALVEALRCSPELTGSQGKRRRASTNADLLSKVQILALRLRIAEGLECNAWTSDEAESAAESFDDHSAAQEETLNADTTSTESDGEPEGMDDDEDMEEAVKHSPEPESINDKRAAQHAEQKSIEGFQSELRILIDSIPDDKEAWEYLKKVGAKFSNGYSLPHTKERFDSQKGVAHHLLTKSIICLDLQKNKLPREELQRFHRWLKFYFVKSKLQDWNWRDLAEAMDTIRNTEEIIRLLEKIGFKHDGGGFYRHEKSCTKDSSLHIEEVVNMIRAHEDSLMTIGQDKDSSRSRRRRTNDEDSLSPQDDTKLRYFAAASNVPLLFFDEEVFCAESQEDDQEDAMGDGTDLCSAGGAELSSKVKEAIDFVSNDDEAIKEEANAAASLQDNFSAKDSEPTQDSSTVASREQEGRAVIIPSHSREDNDDPHMRETQEDGLEIQHHSTSLAEPLLQPKENENPRQTVQDIQPAEISQGMRVDKRHIAYAQSLTGNESQPSTQLEEEPAMDVDDKVEGTENVGTDEDVDSSDRAKMEADEKSAPLHHQSVPEESFLEIEESSRDHETAAHHDTAQLMTQPEQEDMDYGYDDADLKPKNLFHEVTRDSAQKNGSNEDYGDYFESPYNRNVQETKDGQNTPELSFNALLRDIDEPNLMTQGLTQEED